MNECKICGKECNSIQSFTKHIILTHKMSTQEYYNTYIDPSSKICPVCNLNERKYINITKGYSNTCGHKCKMTRMRKELKEDPTKFESFVSKVKTNMVDFHKNMSVELKEERSKKIHSSVSKYMESLTEVERVEIYGWLNKLNEEDREYFITEVMLKTGCHVGRDSTNIHAYIDKVKNAPLYKYQENNISAKLGICFEE